MKRWTIGVTVVGLLAALALPAHATGVGAGARYFKTIDELDGPFEEDGLAPLLTVKQDLAALLSFQVDLVLYPDGYAGAAKDVLAPEAFLVLGQSLYAALGAGTLYADGDFGDPFFVARVGFDLELLPGLHLDINGNYEFAEWEGINEVDDEADSDTITLGAAVRLDL